MKFFTLKEAAKVLGVSYRKLSVSTTLRKIKDGKFVYVSEREMYRYQHELLKNIKKPTKNPLQKIRKEYKKFGRKMAHAARRKT